MSVSPGSYSVPGFQMQASSVSDVNKTTRKSHVELLHKLLDDCDVSRDLDALKRVNK